MTLPFEGSLALRRRGFWEAFDAGLLLWRENVVYFLPFFAIPFWICAFGLRLFPERMRFWSWFILWFCKPLFDRLMVHVISARFFESGADMRRLCRGLLKNLCRGLAGDISWRRFSPLRAALMPMRVLENAPRGRIEERKEILKKGGAGFCFLLTVWGLALEIMLLAGEILFCVIMMEFIQGDFFSMPFDELLKYGEIFIFALWCFNYMLVESLYVCMGFGLYINSRVEVEGWDIEILFRGFAEKYKRKNTVLTVFVFFILLGLLPVKSFADGGEEAADNNRRVLTANEINMPDNNAPLEALRTVLDSPDFGGERDGWGIRWKNPRQPKEMPSVTFSPWLGNIRQFFASALRLFLIGLVTALAVFLLLRLRKLGLEIPRRKGLNMRGLRHSAEEGPDSLLAKARSHFDRGDLRRAWGFCAAGAVRSWSAYRGLAFPPGATEYDCVDLVQRETSGPGGVYSAGNRQNEAQAFAALLNYWIAFAYGGRLPPEGSFEEALAFCDSLALCDSPMAENGRQINEGRQ